MIKVGPLLLQGLSQFRLHPRALAPRAVTPSIRSRCCDVDLLLEGFYRFDTAERARELLQGRLRQQVTGEVSFLI
jgi:hypothetical protein